jgi:CBS domain-containing protein
MVFVKDIMSKSPIFVKPDDFVTKARSIIRDFGYRTLPVLENNKLVGIISREDILRITSSKTNIEVKGIMKKNVISIHPDAEIFLAMKEIVRWEVRQLPVVKDDILVGIVSSMDILKSVVKNKYKPIKKRIEEVMSKNVIYCEVDDELSKVWEKIYEKGFSGLPVLKKGKVIGMISRSDIIKHGNIRLSKESGRVKDAKVKKVMRTPAKVVTKETKIMEAAKLMLRGKISRLPVVNKDKKLEGIVDVGDILKAYII